MSVASASNITTRPVAPVPHAPRDGWGGRGRWNGLQHRIHHAASTDDVRAKASRLFAAKWGSVQAVVRFRGRRGGLQPTAVDDILQLSGLFLWRQCLRAADPAGPTFEIACDVVARAGYTAWKRDDLRQPRMRLGDGERAVPSRPRTLRVDGVEYNIVDARLDHGLKGDAPLGGLATPKQVGAYLGISRQRVHQLRNKLGGVRLGRRWGYRWDRVTRFGGGASRTGGKGTER